MLTLPPPQVVTGLNQLSNAVNELLRAYINHTNGVVGGTADASSTLAISNPLATMSAIASKTTPTPTEAKPKRKKKEKKERDPNEPKRPLTAAFLFGQKARPVVKVDLEEKLPPGEKLAPNAVNEEITRRWNLLTDEQKEVSSLQASRALFLSLTLFRRSGSRPTEGTWSCTRQTWPSTTARRSRPAFSRPRPPLPSSTRPSSPS